MSDNTANTKKEALIIAHQPDLTQTVRSELEQLGWQTVATNSVGPARKLVRKNELGLIVLDEALFTEADAQLGPMLQERPNPILLLLVTTQNGQALQHAIDLAPDALIEYPLPPQALQNTLHRLTAHQRPDIHILGKSEAIRQIRQIIRQIAPTPVSVLITGESGAGKNLIAEAIHQLSPRKDKRFITINCGAIPETLLESELFGHEKGAFTDARIQREGIFEAANNGTVFLDEIGEMSLSAQVRLLRVLDAREVTRLGSTQPLSVDVRVIAATNRDLQQAVSAGQFRQDLYQRLRVVEIEVPPLRSRPEDVPQLIEQFVKQHSAELNMPPITFDDDALRVLQQYRWPGNARELKNLINRIMVLSTTRQITTTILSDHLQSTAPPTQSNTSNLPVHLGKTTAESDRDLLYWAILEVARDIKELKAYLMQHPPSNPVRSLPFFHPDQAHIDPATEVEYTEASPMPSEEDIRPLQDVERDTIIKALRATGGHRKKAAELLGMAERTLYRKIQQYNL